MIAGSLGAREFAATVEVGYTHGSDGDGVRIRIGDQASRGTIVEICLPIEAWGSVLANRSDVPAEGRLWPATVERLGRIQEHRRITVPGDWSHALYGDAEAIVANWRDENEPETIDDGWIVEIPRGDGTTHSNGFNRHRLGPGGYEFTLRRWIEPGGLS